MIIQLGVSNVALIKKLNMEIETGMTVLTGETGAGKSIIIDSINMILGDRTRKEIVRSGEDRASVQAVFEIDELLGKELSGDGIEVEENQLILSREITSDGKSVCRVNGTIVTLTYLRELSSKLVNIHGQHDNQALLNPKKHIGFIDRFGKCDLELSAYIAEYQNYREIGKRIEKLGGEESERMKRLDLIRYQLTELEKANLKSGEEEELKQRRDILANSETIATVSATVYDSLYGAEGSAYDSINIAIKRLEEVSDFLNASDMIESLTNSMYAVEEAARDASSFADGLEYNERELLDIESRLSQISSLKRKYGTDVDGIIEYFEKIKKECDELCNADELLAKLESEREKIKNNLTRLSKDLTRARKAAAKKLQDEICVSLSELDMGTARFEVRIGQKGDFSSNGCDTAEFFISTNAGEEPKELEKVASGGELSRVMLAMKSVLADSDNVDTLIFDEIDTGVSGNAAKKIAEKLAKIAKTKQVICISHLARIAAAADTHFYIQKSVSDERTETSIKKLNTSERIREMARITDGDITEMSLAHAEQMLNSTGKTVE